MKRIRYTMPARSQGKLYMQGAMAEKDVHRWLCQRLNGFYCDLQVMYIPHPASPTLAGTRIVLNNARGLNLRDAVKAIVEATGLNPHLSVCGWPFCLGDMDDADNTEGVA